MNISTLTYDQLMNEILFNEDGLYNEFDEQKFLNKGYTHEELITITSNWIIKGDECFV